MKFNQNNNYYNKILQPYAKENRYQMSKAEACLWKYTLRGRSMAGYRFTRQRSVMKYIADFMCKELKLIIEVDGYTHTLEEVGEKDKFRQAQLENSGYTIIRFKDEEVLKHIEVVKQYIFQVIEDLEQAAIHPRSA